MSLKSICIYLILLVPAFNASAQLQPDEHPDPLEEQFQLYRHSRPQATLFVHFDKNVYSNGEKIWFSGYLLNEKPGELPLHNLLSLALVRDADSSVVKQQKFIINHGLCYGNLSLPDSLLAGNYHLMASTNRVQGEKPDAIFIQPIIIRTSINLPFHASLKVLESGISGQKPTQMLLSVTSIDSRFLPKPVQVSYRYGNTSGKASTNVSGELLLKLDEQEGLTDPNVYFKLNYDNDSSYLNLPVPVSRHQATLHFYPEGGHLINGLAGQVAWEVRDQQLAMVSTRAQLLKNGRVTDTIETDSKGTGRFWLTPEKDSIYTVRLLHSGFTDRNYALPAALDDGLTLHLKKAAVQDTLQMLLKTREHRHIYIRIHNYRESFIYYSIHFKNLLSMKIALANVPKGLHTVTISDSLGRPLAERMFFAHYRPSSSLSLSTDRQQYRQREKVTLKLGLKLPDTLGVVSVACVQDSRLPGKLATDIENYTYLAKELNGTFPNTGRRTYEDPEQMEELLLIKGWSRYTWTDLLKAKASDTIRTYRNTSPGIRISGKKKPIDKPLEIALLKPKGMATYSSSPTGHLDFPLEDLITDLDRPLYVFVNEKKKHLYQLDVQDPYYMLNKAYLKTFDSRIIDLPSVVRDNRSLILKDHEGALQLKEVEISSRKDHFKPVPKGMNRCGDYVCMNNILNCENHWGDPNNRQPVPGRRYRSGYLTVVYTACTEPVIDPGLVAINGVYSKKEFYHSDHSDPLEPAFLTTLYWKHDALLNEKEQEISFYTGDVTGKFRVVVQGVGTNDVLYGDVSFEVLGK